MKRNELMIKRFCLGLVILLLSLSLLRCSQSWHRDHFQFVGGSLIPCDFKLMENVERDDNILFLDGLSGNVLITKPKSLKKDPTDFDLFFTATLFNKKLLKNPVAMCQDENQILYIAQTKDQVGYDGGLGFTGPFTFHILKLDKQNQITEYSNLQEKISEIKQKNLEARSMILWKNYLVVTFKDTSYVLLIDKASLDKPSPRYIFQEISSQYVYMVGHKDMLWFLCYKTKELVGYQLNQNNELIQKEKIQIPSVPNYTELLCTQNTNQFVLFYRDFQDDKKSKLHLISLDTHNIKTLPAKNIRHVFSLQGDGREGFYTFEEMRKVLLYNYRIYKIK